MMDTSASSAPPGDGSATLAPPPEEPDPSASSAPPGDGPPTIQVPAIEGPVWVGWREGALTRAKELEALCLWVKPRDIQDNDEVLAKAIDRHLEAARQAARGDPPDPHRRFRIFRNGFQPPCRSARPNRTRQCARRRQASARSKSAMKTHVSPESRRIVRRGGSQGLPGRGTFTAPEAESTLILIVNGRHYKVHITRGFQ